MTENHKHNASCQCGAATYRLTGMPLTCYTCHCTNCQSESGGVCTVSMIVNRESVEVTGGEVAVNRYSHKGANMSRHHCAACGSALWFSAEAMPEYLALKAGAFEHHTWYQPIAHIWLRSAQPWLALQDDAAKFQQQPEMSDLFGLWAEKYG